MRDDGDKPHALTGETLLGRYLVEGLVAEGGFARVYRARHLELDVPVAVKVLVDVDRYTGASREAYLALFRQEARTVASLNHPALVRVLDFGALTDGGGERPWMAMEWLDGTTLEDDLRARAGAGRSPREVLDLLRPAFDALACAHDAGVSHRDLKPANLMCVKAPRGAPALRVIDFGVAKVDERERDAGSGQTETRSSLVAYSAPYAAPEQVAHTRTGPWTDVHAMGLIVVELLTGVRAYGDATDAALVEEILRAQRPTPARRGLDVGPWEAVLDRSLTRLPAGRPANAGAMWSELASSVEEAQAAWSVSPRARFTPTDPSSAVTRDEPAVTARPDETPRATPQPPDDRPPSITRSTWVTVARPAAPRAPWIAGAALLIGAAVVAALSLTRHPMPRRATPAARPEAGATTAVAVAPAVTATVLAPPPTPPTPEIARPAARSAPTPRRLARPRAVADAGAVAPRPAPAEPEVVVE